jgi:hypothetical protein
MAQTTILAAGTTAATSTDFTIAEGSSIKVGIACAGAIGSDDVCTIFEVSPLGERVVQQLNSSSPSTLIGTGTYRVKRKASTASVAVYTEA